MDKEEAMKILKDFHDKSAIFSVRTALETLHPELKESEDEKIRKAILNYLTKMWGNSQDDVCGVHVEDAIAWLEKQGGEKPQRMISAEAKEALYDKPDWSEKDENVLEDIEEAIINYWHGDTQDILLDWLKYLRPQPKKEWSEEDEKMIGRIRGIVEAYAFFQSAVDVNGDLCEKEYIEADNWLKSLKDKYTWKSSDKQMKALDSVIDEYDSYPEFDSLVSLKNDLRKL